MHSQCQLIQLTPKPLSYNDLRKKMIPAQPILTAICMAGTGPNSELCITIRLTRSIAFGYGIIQSSRMTDPAELRREYTQHGLSQDNALPDAIAQFRLWFEQALTAQIIEPNAMTLSTVSSEGMPNARTVLMKAYDERGFVFFTNYESAKAHELASNPQAALLFPWLALERQVKIRGQVEKISTTESLKYFLSRPRGSQLGAWVSAQSSVISGRKVLELKLAEMKRKFGEGEIPLPDHWGGIRVKPATIEFWQGRPNRLHDRLQYTAVGDKWKIERLAP